MPVAVTVLPVPTVLSANEALPTEQVTTSGETGVTVHVAVAAVVRSYTLFEASTVAVNAAGVMSAVPEPDVLLKV